MTVRAVLYVPDTNPAARKVGGPRFDKNGRPIYIEANDPNKFNYPNNSFYSYIESVVVSSNAKTLAQPTLLVQEGEKAIVQAGESVITGVSKNTQENGTVEFVNQRKTMGLTLDVDVQKIDDNGFISMKLIPEISVPIPAGTQEGVAIYNEITESWNPD